MNKEIRKPSKSSGDPHRLVGAVLEEIRSRVGKAYEKSERRTLGAGTPAAPQEQSAAEDGVIVYDNLEESQLARAEEARARIGELHEEIDEPSHG